MAISYLSAEYGGDPAILTLAQPTFAGALLSTDFLVSCDVVYGTVGDPSDSCTTPAGWTTLRHDIQSNGSQRQHTYVFGKFVGAGAASYAFTRVGGGTFPYLNGMITAWRGVDPTTPFAVGGSESANSGGFNSVASSPGVTLSQASTVVFWGTAWSANIIKPSAFSQAAFFDGSGSNFNVSYLNFGAGATGSITAASGPGFDAWAAETFALIAIGAGGGQPSTSVTPLALTLAGQAIKGARAGMVSPVAFSFIGQTIKGARAGKASPLALTLAGQAVKGARAGLVAPAAFTLAGQAIKGARAGKVSPVAFTLSGQAVKGARAGRVDPLALALSGQSIKGARKGIVSPLALTLTLNPVSWSATGPGAQPVTSVTPLVLSFTGGTIQGKVAGKVSPVALALAGQTIRARIAAMVAPAALTWTAWPIKGARAGKVSPLALSYTGQGVKGARAGRVAPLTLALTLNPVSWYTAGSGAVVRQVSPLVLTLTLYDVAWHVTGPGAGGFAHAGGLEQHATVSSDSQGARASSVLG